MDSSYGLPNSGVNSLNGINASNILVTGSGSHKQAWIPMNLPEGTDSIQLAGQRPRKKSVIGATFDVLKGIGKGAVNTVSSLLSVKGLLMTAGTIGVCALVGPPIIPFLVAAGVLTGGAQIAKGASSGNWENVGEGIFTLGTTMLGAKYAPTATRNAAGEQLVLSNSVKAGAKTPGFIEGMFKGTWNQIRMVFGEKLVNPANPQARASVYKLAGENARHNWSTLSQQAANLKKSTANFNTRIDQIAQGNPKLQESMAETLGTHGKVSLSPTRTQSTNPQVQEAMQQFAKEQPVAWNLSNTKGTGAILGADAQGTVKNLQD